MFRTITIALCAAVSSLALAAPAEATTAATYTCYCEEDCGNGGLGANAGKVVPGAQSATLKSYFGLQRSGHSDATGWTCLKESTRYSCQETSLTPRQALLRYGSDAPATCGVSGAKGSPARDPATPPKRSAGR